MKVTFWLVDINSEFKAAGAELWLWGIDTHGNRVLVIDRGFVDYFYVVVEEGFDPAKVAEELKKTQGKAIVKLEIAPRRFFGKPVQTIKVYTDDVPSSRRQFEARRSKRLPRRRHSPVHALPHRQQHRPLQMARNRSHRRKKRFRRKSRQSLRRQITPKTAGKNRRSRLYAF